ncbi:MAG: hypothetical protein Q8912_06330 [Bacillota bacterium]|nr:hypothetical protein [Bacillota bacterium]
MDFKCPKCNAEYSSISWDTATLKAKGINKINDFSDDDIESIELQIPNYTYICPGCGAESALSNGSLK